MARLPLTGPCRWSAHRVQRCSREILGLGSSPAFRSQGLREPGSPSARDGTRVWAGGGPPWPRTLRPTGVQATEEEDVSWEGP